MIRLIYRSEKLWHWPQALWCLLIFLLNSLLFSYIILKCTFQIYCPRPPLPLTITILLLILIDRLYPLTRKLQITLTFALDIVIWILVLLSMVLDDENVVCFMGLAVIVSLWDGMYVKEVMFDLVRRKYWLYKTYIIFKILYWIVMYGHLIGCIFYAIEAHLLQI